MDRPRDRRRCLLRAVASHLPPSADLSRGASSNQSDSGPAPCAAPVRRTGSPAPTASLPSRRCQPTQLLRPELDRSRRPGHPCVASGSPAGSRRCSGAAAYQHREGSRNAGAHRGPQRVRHLVARRVPPHAVGQRDQAALHIRTGPAALYMLADLGRLGGLQLAVHVRLDQQAHLIAPIIRHVPRFQPVHPSAPGVRARPRHHGADWHASDLSDLLVGKLFELAQHEALAQFERQGWPAPTG